MRLQISPLFFFMDSAAMNVHRENGKETFDYKKQVDIQTQLIYSLRARIEELETDSLVKDQSINKLQREIFDLKKSIQTIYDNFNTLSGTLFGNKLNYKSLIVAIKVQKMTFLIICNASLKYSQN